MQYDGHDMIILYDHLFIDITWFCDDCIVLLSSTTIVIPIHIIHHDLRVLYDTFFSYRRWIPSVILFFFIRWIPSILFFFTSFGFQPSSSLSLSYYVSRRPLFLVIYKHGFHAAAIIGLLLFCGFHTTIPFIWISSLQYFANTTIIIGHHHWPSHLAFILCCNNLFGSFINDSICMDHINTILLFIIWLAFMPRCWLAFMPHNFYLWLAHFMLFQLPIASGLSCHSTIPGFLLAFLLIVLAPKIPDHHAPLTRSLELPIIHYWFISSFFLAHWVQFIHARHVASSTSRISFRLEQELVLLSFDWYASSSRCDHHHNLSTILHGLGSLMLANFGPALQVWVMQPRRGFIHGMRSRYHTLLGFIVELSFYFPQTLLRFAAEPASTSLENLTFWPPIVAAAFMGNTSGSTMLIQEWCLVVFATLATSYYHLQHTASSSSSNYFRVWVDKFSKLLFRRHKTVLSAW